MTKERYKTSDSYWQEHRRAREMRDAGAVWFMWLSAYDGKVCVACAAANERVRPIADLDVSAHHKACTSEGGCRCVCGPAEPPLLYKKRSIHICIRSIEG